MPRAKSGPTVPADRSRQRPPRRIPLSARVQRLVWVKAGGQCALPECRRQLVTESPDGSEAAVLGEIAHIVAQSHDGPRGSGAVPDGDRNGEPNLMLVCPTCHVLLDDQPQTYTVERLIGIKAAHEAWVRERFGVADAEEDLGWRLEVVHSTLLAVERVPTSVWLAPTTVAERDIRVRIRPPDDSSIMLPFIVRAGNMITFTPLEGDHPFVDVLAEPNSGERHDAREWWIDEDRARWYVALLNRSLNKLTGRRGLQLDKEHNRYFFEPDRDPEGKPLPREITYRPLARDEAKRSVVWQPIKRKTGEARNYWTHLAVGLRFIRVATAHWVLAIRPELRFTIDGTKPLVPKAIGRRATRFKSHMYNSALLSHLQFWKEYLADGGPRILMDFGGQVMVIDARLGSTEVEWPGVAVEDEAVAFENVAREEDLFTLAAYDRVLAGVTDPDVELEQTELDDLSELTEHDDDDPR